jgi:hypothetical protein
MASENGTLFFVVEGNCRFWYFRAWVEPARTGTLGDAEVATVVETFQLESWQGPIASTSGGLGLASTWLIFGRDDSRPPCGPHAPTRECDQAPLRSSAGIDHNAVRNGLLSIMDDLAQVAHEVAGDMRYVLFEGDFDITEQDWTMPGITWALGDPADVAIPSGGPDFTYAIGSSRLVTGADAAALRALRQQFLDGQISGHDPRPGYGARAIPLLIAGQRYSLFVRDTFPFEDDRGLILF